MFSAIVSTFAYFWATYGCVAIGVLYFVCARRDKPVVQRLLASIYAPIAGILFVAATFTDPEYWSLGRIPLFLVLQLVPLALLIYSIRRYAGPRWVQFVLVPAALGCWGWQVVLGYLGIYGQ
jgi:hypothetical protein